MFHKKIIYLVLFLLAGTFLNAQEETPFVSYDVPSQNLLKFNRFLINPTFSTVRENKSYINLLHRNQSVSFDDNNQDYFLSYSGRVSDRSGLGLSLYTQREGLISNYGIMANYAYGVKLSDKSNFTFGANLAYYNSGFDRNRAAALDPNDPSLNGLQDSNLLSFQPGFNISYGKFDFGVFAENLFDYNLKTSESVTDFRNKTFSGHLQYTHEFESNDGIFEHGRLMPLARVRKVGPDEVVLGGSLILDLPKLGWLQTGYDSFYGASAGIGFNINKRLSLGYTMEKGLSNNFDNFGLTHEISFAYSITPTLTEDRVLLEADYDQLVENELDPEEVLTAQEVELEKLKKALAENDGILAELMFRQDSIEAMGKRDLERRFEMVMKMVRDETRGERPDLEERAREIYLPNNERGALALQLVARDADKKSNGINELAQTKDAIGTPRNRTGIDPITSKSDTDTDEFSQIAKQNNIKSKKFQDLDGVQDGYYVVANVYKGEKYLNTFVNQLTQEGVKADYFENPKNGLKYVYLERYDTWQEALAAHKSNVNGTYTGDKWIMNVDNRSNYTDADKAYVSNVNKIKEKSAGYTAGQPQKNVVAKDNINSNKVNARNYKIQGVDTGFYIIANVFANANNANKFVKLLNSQGLHASYFINPENNYRYVYLKKYESWNTALVSYYSNLNDTYKEQMWIMRVAPGQVG
ncbi:MAG TPA: PorP/SprF family type IX secretion system membrane protein [Arenibacter sp.]|nr:PorP/SprF family type IX secretion system membrane protein [Arenibacter sp.]